MIDSLAFATIYCIFLVLFLEFGTSIEPVRLSENE